MRKAAGSNTQKNSRACATAEDEAPGVRPASAARITATCAMAQIAAAIQKIDSEIDAENTRGTGSRKGGVPRAKGAWGGSLIQLDRSPGAISYSPNECPPGSIADHVDLPILERACRGRT